MRFILDLAASTWVHCREGEREREREREKEKERENTHIVCDSAGNITVGMGVPLASTGRFHRHCLMCEFCRLSPPEFSLWLGTRLPHSNDRDTTY